MIIAPKHFNIFHNFVRHASLLNTAIDLLGNVVTATGEGADSVLTQVRKLERDGDDILRRTDQQLDRQLTDAKEDAYRLFVHLDKVLDAVELLVGRLAAFRLGRLPGPGIRMMNVIESCRKVLGDSIEAFGEGNHFAEQVAEMADLENEADEIYVEALRELFEHETDPVRLIKLNETYGVLETIVNLYEECLQAMEDVALKHFSR